MFLLDDAKEELRFWETLQGGLCSPITLPSLSQSLDMDASNQGVRIYFNGVLLSEPVGLGHINVTELVALDQALDRFQDEIRPGMLT